jgi:hypothetical protein
MADPLKDDVPTVCAMSSRPESSPRRVATRRHGSSHRCEIGRVVDPRVVGATSTHGLLLRGEQ